MNTQINDETKEVLNKVYNDTKLYVYNIITDDDSEFNEDVYNELKYNPDKDPNKENLPFKDFSEEEMLLNVTAVLEGYGCFGTKFIEKVVDKDPASVKSMFEAVVQDYLDLQHYIEEYTSKFNEIIKQAQTKEN